MCNTTTSCAALIILNVGVGVTTTLTVHTLCANTSDCNTAASGKINIGTAAATSLTIGNVCTGAGACAKVTEIDIGKAGTTGTITGLCGGTACALLATLKIPFDMLNAAYGCTSGWCVCTITPVSGGGVTVSGGKVTIVSGSGCVGP